MKNKILNNLGLKILALLISLMLWLIVINLNDPVMDKPYSGIKVEVINADALSDEGKVYEILEGTGTVSVVIYAPRTVIENLSKDDIHAVADLSQISVSNTVEITAYSDRNNDQIEKITIAKNSLKLSIENELSKQVLIDAQTTGEPAEGYIVGDVSTNQNIVRLSGPESVISTISSASVSVDVSGMSSSISTNTEIKLYDADGVEVTNESVVKNINAISLNAEILATKYVNLAFSSTGSPQEGYLLNGTISSNPSRVLIAGNEDDLSDVSRIVVAGSELDVTDISENLVRVIDITPYLPEGIRLGNLGYSGMATVTVEVEPEIESTFIYNEQHMFVGNGTDNVDISVKEMANHLQIKLAGLASTIAGLTEDDVKVSIDMNDIIEEYGLDSLKAGTYLTPVYIELPDGVRLLEQETVTVIVKDRVTDAQ